MRNKIIIGIDIGGTKTRVGYLGKDNNVKIIGHVATSQDPVKAINNIADIIRSAQIPGEINKIGIVCPGPLNQKTGMILSPPNLPKWDDFPIVEILKKEFGVDTILENDANAGALGEAVFGAAQNAHTVLYFSLSTGIGAGIVINKKVHIGYKGLAGEIWCVPPKLFGANTGERSILDLSSGNGMVELAKEQISKGVETIIRKDQPTSYEIFDAFHKGDKLAIQLIENAREILNGTMVFSSCLLAPDVIVLGGGLTNDL
ncbi:ROK family protein, partial [Draconibacterium sp.]|nr:ROK family protein [Draconibacterium sp.]